MVLSIATIMAALSVGVFSQPSQTMTYYQPYQKTQYDTGLGFRVLIRGLSSQQTVLSYYDGLNRERYDLVNFTASYSVDTWTVSYSINTSINYYGIVGLYSTADSEYVASANVNFYDNSIVNQTFTYQGSSTNVYFACDFVYLDSGQYGTLTGTGGSFQDGYNQGVEDGKQIGKDTGFQDGYAQGKADFENQDAQINSIFEGILSIGLIPIEFFLSIFNFSIFGINITAIISAILTLCVIIILMRYVLGGKSN